MPKNNGVIDSKFLHEAYHEVFTLRNNDFFNLLETKFYLQEFLFFSQEAYFFAKLSHTDEDIAKELGLVSSLVYLSAKIHYFINNEAKDGFAKKVQFPILLGDLLYGKVIEILSRGVGSVYIDDYLAYLQRLNAVTVDYFADKAAEKDVICCRYSDLAVLTAKLLGAKNTKLAAEIGASLALDTLYHSNSALLAQLSAEESELFMRTFHIKQDPKSIIVSTADLCQKILAEA